MIAFSKYEIKDRIRPLGLALPLIGFIAITFVIPLGTTMFQSIYDDKVAVALPNTLSLLQDWEGTELPDESVYVAIADEIAARRADRTIGQVATRVNRVAAGTRSVWGKTARKLRDAEGDDMRSTLTQIDERWSELELWRGIKEAGRTYVARHYLHAVDLERSDAGAIVRVEEDERVYMALYLRTLYVAMTVTVLCLVIGYPLAYAIAHTSAALSRVLLILVLVPFWTSLLARTTSWLVLFKAKG